MHIVLAGGSRGVGYEVARNLIAQGHHVTALLRSEQAMPTLETLGANPVRADAVHAVELESAVLACKDVDAVITTMGGMPQDPQGQRVDYVGNRNLMEAALKAGIQRFLLVSSIGCGNSADAIPPRAREVLGAVLAEKTKAEQHLIHSGLIYTIVRPGGLVSEPATGQGGLTEDPQVSGTIHRADVADLVCQCLGAQAAENRVFSAIDRHMVTGDADVAWVTLTETD